MNKNLLTNIISFVIGAGIGAVGAAVVVKKHYDAIIDDEVESVREAFAKNYEKTVEEENEKSEKLYDDAKEAIKKYSAASDVDDREEEPADDADDYDDEEEEEVDNKKPYVISPEEFGASEYAIISLTHFSDGTVINDKDKIVSNSAELLGDDFADHFDDYETDPDVVYVRNDALGIDFEVLRDYQEYSEYTELR